MKNYVHIKMCTQVFQSALFVITKLPQVEITYVSLVGQMLKQTMMHAYHELPPDAERNGVLMHATA